MKADPVLRTLREYWPIVLGLVFVAILQWLQYGRWTECRELGNGIMNCLGHYFYIY